MGLMSKKKTKALEEAADSPIVVDPMTNAILTAVFAAQVFGIVWALATAKFFDMKISNVEMIKAFFAACAAVTIIINFVKYVSRRCGAFLSKNIFPGDPLKKRRTMKKFEDQMWQLTIHISMSALEYYILFVEHGEASWYTHYYMTFSPHKNFQINSASLHVLYLLQIAIWIVTCVQHRFIEERHKDYVMMYVHHICTIGLVGGSYYCNYLRVGSLVLWVHDVSDILVDLIKIFNYCQLEGRKGFFLVEAVFFSNFGVWAYYRMYYLSKEIIWYRVIYGGREVGSAPGSPELIEFSKIHGDYTRGHSKDWRMGDGTFDLIQNFKAIPSARGAPLYYEAASMLIALQVMHCIWYFMFLRILYRSVAGKEDTYHGAGEEVYEGESDDEPTDNKKSK